MFKCSFIEAAVRWDNAQQIAGDIGANIVMAKVAIDNVGNIVVVWKENSGDSNKDFIKGGVLNLTDGGRLFFKEPPTLISNPNESATSPELSMN